MKIIRLEQDRIKVILSERELIDMNIDIETLSPNSPELGGFLRAVMNAVRAETGFSLENGQVMVEASTYKDGIVLLLYRTKQKSRIKGVKLSGKKESTVFEFRSLDDLGKLLMNTERRYILTMRLYRYRGNLYVALPKSSIPFLMYEFSLKNGKSALCESVLSEYGDLIAGGDKLVIMAKGLKNII